MYRKFFGLNALPFKTTPELEMFYRDGSRQQILEALLYTIARGDGILKVTGEVGSGKTMLLRLLASKLPSDTEIIYINSPNLSSKDILLYICNELHIDTSAFNEKFSLSNALKSRLLELHSQGKRVVMLIDEAQAMTFDALEEIRLFSNLETSHDKLIQIVLFGQPELDVAMENEKVRQIKSRISYNIYVPPLNYNEVYEYLNYRMRQAGYSGLDVFDLKISKKITKLSDGLPRQINVIADKALMACFGMGDKKVTNKHLKNLPDLIDKPKSKFNLFILLFLMIVFVGIGSFFAYEYFKNNHLNKAFALQLDQSNGNELTLPPSIQKNKTSAEVASSFSGVDEVNANVSNSYDPDKSTEQMDSIEVQEANASVDIGLKNAQISQGSNEVAILDLAAEGEKIDDSEYKEINAGLKTIDNYEHPYTYNPKKLLEPFKSISERNQLDKLLFWHEKSKQWLRNENSKYIIQLSTRNINSLDVTLEFYQKYKFSNDLVKILIDFNPNVNFFRLKVFYFPTNSFSEINAELESLDKRLKRAGPYIIEIDSLKDKLKLTEQKLKEVGIVDD